MKNRRPAIFFVVCSVVMVVVVVCADVKKGYYHSAELGSIRQAASGELSPDSNYQVSAYLVPGTDLVPGWQPEGGDLLQRLPQHDLHHNAAATAGSDLGSRSKQDEGNFWRSYSRRPHEENHPVSSSSLYGREPQTLKFGTRDPLFGSCSIVALAEPRG